VGGALHNIDDYGSQTKGTNVEGESRCFAIAGEEGRDDDTDEMRKRKRRELLPRNIYRTASRVRRL
jgi:hypothetical protein